MRFDLPTIEEEQRPWWRAAQEHRLLVQRCSACGQVYLYPRPFCPTCWGLAVTWEEASGRATLYTWSVVYSNDLPPFKARLPYVAALVELEEGPRLMTNIVEVPLVDLRIGAALEVAWHEDDEAGQVLGLEGPLVLPFFRPTTLEHP